MSTPSKESNYVSAALHNEALRETTALRARLAEVEAAGSILVYIAHSFAHAHEEKQPTVVEADTAIQRWRKAIK